MRKKEGSHAGILSEKECKGSGVGPAARLRAFSRMSDRETYRRHRLSMSLGILLVSFTVSLFFLSFCTTRRHLKSKTIVIELMLWGWATNME